jgi:hypothetical protein
LKITFFLSQKPLLICFISENKNQRRFFHVKEKVFIRSIGRVASSDRVSAGSAGYGGNKRSAGVGNVRPLYLHQPGKHLAEHFGKRNGYRIRVRAENACREKHLSLVNLAAELQRHMVKRKKLVCILDVLVGLHPRNISGVKWHLQG